MSSADMMGVSRGRDPYGYGAEPFGGGPRASWAEAVGTIAGSLLGVVASFEILQGIAGLAKNGTYAKGLDYVYKMDTTAWGWTHIAIGVLLFVVAIGILARQTWAHVTGLLVAGLSTLTNFAFVPYYPVWALTIIAINILIICALCTLIRTRGRDGVPEQTV